MQMKKTLILHTRSKINATKEPRHKVFIATSLRGFAPLLQMNTSILPQVLKSHSLTDLMKAMEFQASNKCHQGTKAQTFYRKSLRGFAPLLHMNTLILHQVLQSHLFIYLQRGQWNSFDLSLVVPFTDLDK